MRRIPTICALIWLAVAASAETSDAGIVEILAKERARDAVLAKALAFLRTQQQVDGALAGDYRAACTSLGMLAHFACGVTLENAEHGPWLRKSLNHVLSLQDDSGYFGARDATRGMYGHGMSTLMLAEALGQSNDDDLEETMRRALERALKVTIAAAQVAKSSPLFAGGWRYVPEDVSSDLSPSGWQVMSLHASQQVGIQIPEAVLSGAATFAQRLVGPDGSVGYDVVGTDHPALRGVALLCFAAANQFDALEVARITARIKSDPIAWQGDWFFYRSYYDAVGLSMCAPDIWEAYAPTWESLLLTHQNPEGTWQIPPGDTEASYGAVYTTSMAVLALAVQKHLLPAYQR